MVPSYIASLQAIIFAIFEGEPMSGIVSALTTAMTTIKTDFFTALTSILPIALAIVGAGIVIVLGVRYFKKIANK